MKVIIVLVHYLTSFTKTMKICVFFFSLRFSLHTTVRFSERHALKSICPCHISSLTAFKWSKRSTLKQCFTNENKIGQYTLRFPTKLGNTLQLGKQMPVSHFDRYTKGYIVLCLTSYAYILKVDGKCTNWPIFALWQVINIFCHILSI